MGPWVGILTALVVVAALGVNLVSGGSGLLTGLSLVVGVVLAVGAGVLRADRRAAGREAWAAGVGWVHLGKDPAMTALSVRPPFAGGSATRTAEHMAHGTYRGRAAVSFELGVVVGDGETDGYFTFHVLAVAVPGPLPFLDLAPTRAPERPTGWDAQLRLTDGPSVPSGDDRFDQAYRTITYDSPFAADLLTFEVRERLLDPKTATVTVRCEDTWVLGLRPGEWSVEPITPTLELLSDLADAAVRALGRTGPPVEGSDRSASF
jgi:hypothetical protein